jgi:acetyl-CoA acetyltransferase
MSRIRRRVENEFTRKADQQWDLAGTAREDGDRIAEADHTRLARAYEQQAMESIAEPIQKSSKHSDPNCLSPNCNCRS